MAAEYINLLLLTTFATLCSARGDLYIAFCNSDHYSSTKLNIQNHYNLVYPKRMSTLCNHRINNTNTEQITSNQISKLAQPKQINLKLDAFRKVTYLNKLSRMNFPSDTKF
ncbi:hypothetical protein WICANDRAFT_83461 [Wickerhamomyces anomalus NRRL Y-366-8]|uniref:Secreted protein n=1 Tax=Wickerhamomyces anomalus (strain ATCC 58044 / CBS 1984 / NCYC 433 / NRRL Y-366-8) TaxID=683960 RepID=A0A1E3P7T5_WICAA|nr:uncharacterized protein WICANDRAFT_83461 [Wickerhamomyces anomalus NRRL Y-366-8]ODQ61284.1 hypothetical protein WICANDRAFT_83461 [Wickerhamomyces anomalus NRRL Y-366-8]